MAKKKKQEPTFSLRVQASALAGALSHVLQVKPRTLPTPLLENVLIVIRSGVLSVSATDLDQWAHAHLVVDTLNEVVVAPHGPSLLAAMKQLDDEQVHLEGVPGRLRISGEGSYRAEIPSMENSSDYPHPPDILDTGKAGGFALACRQVKDAMPPHGMRFGLYASLLDCAESVARLVSTDGHRIHVSDPIVGRFQKNHLIPGKLIEAGTRAGDEVEVGIGDTWTGLRMASGEVQARNPEGTFPTWRTVVRRDLKYRRTVNRDDLMSAARRCLIPTSRIPSMRGEHFDSLILDLSSPDITVSIPGPYPASEMVASPFGSEPGEEGRVGITASYLLDAIEVLPDEVEIAWLDGMTIILLRRPGEDWFDSCFCGIMPKRVEHGS